MTLAQLHATLGQNYRNNISMPARIQRIVHQPDVSTTIHHTQLFTEQGNRGHNFSCLRARPHTVIYALKLPQLLASALHMSTATPTP
jgi:hypothetical protein